MTTGPVGVQQIVGARSRQEDFYSFQGPDLLVVADGMGGHAGGDVASRLAVETFLAAYGAAGPRQAVPARLRAALEAANQAVAQQVALDPALEGMGSTLIAAVFAPEGLYWISVGDSPMWRMTSRGFERLNEDHSMAPLLAQMVAQGKMTPAAAAKDPRRNQLLAAVDGATLDMVDCPASPLPLKAGDLVLLATDGVETLSPGRIHDLAREAGPDAARIAEAIVAAVTAADRPRQDNATLLVRQVTETSLRGAGRGPDWRRLSRLVAVTLLTAALIVAGAYAGWKLGGARLRTPATAVKPGPGPGPGRDSGTGNTTLGGTIETRLATALAARLGKAGARGYAISVLSPRGEAVKASGDARLAAVGAPARAMSPDERYDVGEIGQTLTAATFLRLLGRPEGLSAGSPIGSALPAGWSLRPTFGGQTFQQVFDMPLAGCGLTFESLKACAAADPVRGEAKDEESRFALLRLLIPGLAGARPASADAALAGYVRLVNEQLLHGLPGPNRECVTATRPGQAYARADLPPGPGVDLRSASPALICGDGGWRLSARDLANIARRLGQRGFLGAGRPLGQVYRQLGLRRSERALLASGRLQAQDGEVQTLMLITDGGAAVGVVVNSAMSEDLETLVVKVLKEADVH